MDNYTLKHLIDILGSIDEVDSYFEPSQMRFALFADDMKTQRAVERNVLIIGEAVGRILKSDPTFTLTNARQIVNTRNRIVHSYDNVTTEFLWELIIRHLPLLRQEVEQLLARM